EKTATTDSYVLHTIKPGESISRLAQQYYDDYKLFHVIAQFNGMDDATRVTVGQTIKVPRLAGVPFHLPTASEETAAADEQQDYSRKPMEETEDLGTPPEENASGLDAQSLADRDAGIELFNDGRYGDAIFELNKAIEAAPKDKETASYLGRAYLEAGKQHFQAGDFDAARESFESALQYNPQCDQCPAYIEKSKMGPLLDHRTRGMDAFQKNDFRTAIFEFGAYAKIKPDDKDVRTYLSRSYYQQALTNYNKGDYLTAKKDFDSALEYDSTCEKCASYSKKSIQSHKEAHYNKGIVYFSKEQLAEAISEWEMVYDLDPGYKDVEQNLKKAQTLLKRLEKIKKSQK
ncbi:MAG: tetratricopeptide repeat protein, partial [Desulfosarcinaceae bacterium]